MTTVALIEEEFERLRSLASTERLETCAVGFVAPASRTTGDSRFVIRSFEPVPDSAYLVREPFQVALTPQFCMELANRARATGSGVMLAHTHLGGLADFSAVDDAGEKPLSDYFGRRVSGKNHFSMVVTVNGGRCRRLGSAAAATIQIVGRNARRIESNEQTLPAAQSRHDRQVRAFGPDGQAALSSLRIAIVGLGGTGSIIAHETAYLGVNDYVLIDPDIVNETNLNRLLGATAHDTGKRKVDVAARSIMSINPSARCDAVVGDIVDANIVSNLCDVDFIFACTDSHSSRAVLNQFAYQFLVPCVDMGVAIHVRDGGVSHIAGRVQMLSCGLPCLVCANWIDSNQVRTEMMSEEQRRRDPYFVGHSMPHPAVISLNGAVASVAMTMFLSAVTAFPSDARMVLYDAVRGAMRPTIMTPEANCIVCSSSGALARGDNWTLPIRHHNGAD